jgi:Flp pilus assembly protein protease CpaA
MSVFLLSDYKFVLYKIVNCHVPVTVAHIVHVIHCQVSNWIVLRLLCDKTSTSILCNKQCWSVGHHLLLKGFWVLCGSINIYERVFYNQCYFPKENRLWNA